MVMRKYLEYIPLFFMLILYPVCCRADSFLSGITAGFIGMMLLLVCGNIVLIRKSEYCFNRPDLLFLVFALWHGGVSLFRGRVFDTWAVIQSITYVLLYFYCRNVNLKKLFFLLLYVAGLTQAIWSILQLSGVLPSGHPILNGTGCFFNPGILGIFLVLASLAGIALFDKRFSSGYKFLWALGLALLLCGILLSQSRSAWIALMAGCCWLFFTSNRKYLLLLKIDGKEKHFLNYSVLLSVGVIIISAILYSLYALRPESVQGRFLIWQVITKKWTASPWFGQGPLQAAYMPAQAEWFRANPGSVLTTVAGNNTYAFNEFLRITFEAGIIGLVLFLCLLVICGIYAWRGNRFACQAGSLLLAVVCFGQFSYPFSIPLITMVSLITLAMLSQNSLPEYQVVFRPGVPIKCLLCILLCFLLFFTFREYHREKQADRLLAGAQHHPAILADTLMIRLYKHLEGNPDFMLCYGKTLCNHELYTVARPVLEQAYHLKPSSGLVCDLGRCYQYSSQYSQAEQSYLLAAAMTPAHIFPHYCLFLLYRENRRYGESSRKGQVYAGHAGESSKYFRTPVQRSGQTIFKRIRIRPDNVITR